MQGVGHMATPEDRHAEQRRLRTERQRESREQQRICGHCQMKADGGLVEWAGSGQPLRIPICRACQARLAGNWRHMEELNQNQGGMCISGVLRVGVGVAQQGVGP